jgi:hypothetical protein
MAQELFQRLGPDEQGNPVDTENPTASYGTINICKIRTKRRYR